MEVKMSEERKVKGEESGGKENAGHQKLSYEQLNDTCQQLFQQNQYLMKQLREQNLGNMLRRLDYLFRAVELSAAFKDAEFTNSCIDEIKGVMFPPKTDEVKE